MNKKNMIAIYILLGVIIALLIYVIIQNNEMKNEIINAGNYLSEKIDKNETLQDKITKKDVILMLIQILLLPFFPDFYSC